MRILTLPEFYPPVIGGLESHAQWLTHELKRQGHEVAVATLAVCPVNRIATTMTGSR